MLSPAEIGFYQTPEFADPLAALVEGAAARHVYVTGALHLSPRFSDEAISRFARRYPRAVFVNARGRYRGVDDWRRRWRQECQRYGAAIILTAGEATDDKLSPCDDPSLPASRGLHVIGLSVLTEIMHFARYRLPILWHPISPWRSSFILCFAVEGLPSISYSRAARLLPALEARPFHPVISGLFFTVRPSAASNARP
jgi:hypothetical protein